jgi:hypothetical protein
MKIINGVHFPDTYLESRDLFRKLFPAVKSVFPDAVLESKSVSRSTDLKVDWIKAGRESSKNSLVITTGLHGIEGLFGGAFLELFFREFLPVLKPETSLLLLHGINPWGMERGRKVNPNNVDLNRNFAGSESDLEGSDNPEYRLVREILTPELPLGALLPAQIRFLAQVAGAVMKRGTAPLRRAALLGQSENKKGFYYSGTAYQPETRVVMDLLSGCFGSSANVVHLDVHTGYGPGRQMVLVNSPLEERSPDKFAELFQYPAVVAADGDDFFQINGDMLDWAYSWHQKQPGSNYFGTAFEFGTLGDGIISELISLWIMVVENQAYWYGTQNGKIRRKIEKRFRELYYPESTAWREQALQDSRRALTGILSEYEYLR